MVGNEGIFFIPLRKQEFGKGGGEYIGITLSVCLSIGPLHLVSTNPPKLLGGFQ